MSFPKTYSEFEKSFWSKVCKTSYCWYWIGPLWGRGNDSYGRTFRNGKAISSHRCSYLLTYGKIPKGKMVLHSCNNKLCVNPDHLKLGTAKDNSRDAMAIGAHAFCDRNGQSKLTSAAVAEIRDRFFVKKRHKEIVTELRKKYGVHRDTIRRAALGIYWNRVSVAAAVRALESAESGRG